MELPLTEPCPQCGADMEPRKTARRGRTIYECPDCGYQMEIAEAREGQPSGHDRDDDIEVDGEDDDDELKSEDEDEDQEDAV